MCFIVYLYTQIINVAVHKWHENSVVPSQNDPPKGPSRFFCPKCPIFVGKIQDIKIKTASICI